MKIFQLATATEWRTKVAHGETVGFAIQTRQAPERGERNFMRTVFCRPCRGWNFHFAMQPTVSPWATICRASGALAAMILFFAAFGATAETTNTLSDAEIKGRNLANEVLAQEPTTNYSVTGTLQIRSAENSKKYRLYMSIRKSDGKWQSSYLARMLPSPAIEELTVIHSVDKPNQYQYLRDYQISAQLCVILTVAQAETNNYAESDFSFTDLGLEFFHWPAQKVLPNPTPLRRGRAYTLLESTNPNPSTNGYSRVLSWIDKESGGILEAEAYDFHGKLLKDFAPKSFKKVNGQWELQEMEIRNVQTGSRTRLEFDLPK